MPLRQRVAAFFEDSPTYGRDRANLISGFNIGIAGLLLNFVVLVLSMPLMLDPNDPAFRQLSENLEFGQLLALILLGGATVLATLLIPLRMVTVFWGPRSGRYFDQVVLSGISPLRFVIGKATSQNLFVGLILFLLLPYFVLSLSLGGVDLVTFLAGVAILWLYCVALALVTIYASLYFNELLAALFVMWCAAWLCGFGCIPMRPQPFLVTPFPVLLQPVYSALPTTHDDIAQSFWGVFAAAAGCMSGVIGLTVLAIHLGPLYGIVRENSTFGEVVRAGDSQRRKWVRLRPHIQRPSEIAFFYENRGPLFLRNEGLLRWGFGFGALLLGTAIVYGLLLYGAATAVTRGSISPWWAYEFHAFVLTIHGIGVALAVLAFSHPRNTTFARIPFVFGWKVQVSRLDTCAFLVFAVLSLAAAIAIPHQFDQWSSARGTSVFPVVQHEYQRRPINYPRLAVEVHAAFFVAALVIYAWQRQFCLSAWMRSSAFAATAGLYAIGICFLPGLIGALLQEAPALREIRWLSDWAPELMMVSPFVLTLSLFGEMVSPRFPADTSTAPFYLFHYLLLAIALVVIKYRSAKLRQLYLTPPRAT